jgi:hypothetical protein
MKPVPLTADRASYDARYNANNKIVSTRLSVSLLQKIFEHQKSGEKIAATIRRLIIQGMTNA